MSAQPWCQREGLALLTDLYELTMVAGFWKEQRAGQRVCFEYFFRRLPPNAGFAVAATRWENTRDHMLPYAATAILGFMRSTPRAVFAPTALTSTCPRAPQKARDAARVDDAQSAAGHAFCGDGARPMCSRTLEGRLRLQGSGGGHPPAQARRGSH